MEFRILGPLEVLEHGTPLELGGPKQRALLAALLLEANRIVPSSRLIDWLWGERPPETAQKALQVYVSQLRKALGRERLQTQSPGYVLHVDHGELDLNRFEELVEAKRFGEALDLWRGEALADLAAPFVVLERARLEELRLMCLEERLAQELDAGRDAELVAELERSVEQEPLRERLARLLMLALYRSGRQAEALEAYQRVRRTLDELGLEPGRELRELHRRVLNQDASLDRAPPSDAPEPIDTPAPAARETRKTVTVLAVAIPVAEALDPELMLRATDDARTTIEAAIVRHGGAVASVSPEVVTAVFGLPIVHEDDALRAVRSAWELRAIAARFGWRLGLSTGSVLAVSEAGAAARASGGPLLLAARLAREAAPGDVAIDEATWERTRLAIETEANADVRRVLGLVDAAPPRSRLQSPMIGRSRERSRLRNAFDQAAEDRSCQLFTVLGPAGVGKSRLALEFLRDVAPFARVARGRCLPYGEGITFWPLREVVKDLVALDDLDTPEEAHAKLERALATEPAAAATSARVAELIGLTEIAGPADEGFAAVMQLLAAGARDKPFVVVLDDIHWGEPTFLDLVEQTAELVRDAPLLLLCLARPELLDLRPAWGGGKLNATATLLEPLSPDECGELVEKLVGAHADVAATVAAAAEGNPLFVEEMLSMLIDDGVLVEDESGWSARRQLSDLRMPPTINALLDARLDQLDDEERRVIERAAVIGKVFQEGAVRELLDADPGGVLPQLVRKDLVRPDRSTLGERTFRFRHLLIRDAAYGSIPKQDRALLHARYASWLGRVTSGRSTEYDEVLGYHLEQACRYERELGIAEDAERSREAAARLGGAGRRALMRSDGPGGVNLISRAVALLPPDDPQRVELIPNLRVVQGLGLELAWADRVLTDAVGAAETNGDRRLAANALVQRGLLRLFTAADVTPDELVAGADRALEALEDLGDELGQARAWRLKAQANYLRRSAGLCLQASERALVHARKARDRFEEREIVEWLAISLFLGPTPAAEAELRCETLAEELDDLPLQAAMLLSGQALLAAMRADVARARSLRERSRRIMVEQGEWVWIALFWASFLDIWTGDPAAAEGVVRPAYDALKHLGSKSHFTSLAHALAGALYAQRRYDEAEQLTRECEEACGPNDVHSHILWRSIRAKTYARRGRFDAAIALAEESIGYAATSDFLPAHADALSDLAEVLTLAGETQAAATAHEEAVRLYELKGNTLAAATARAGFAELV